MVSELEQGSGRQVHQRRIAARRRKGGAIDRQQQPTLDRDSAMVPDAERHLDPVDLAGADPAIEHLHDAVGELGHAGRMGRHGRTPCRCEAPRRSDRLAARPNQEQQRAVALAIDGIEDALAERTRKALLGAEHHQCPGRHGGIAVRRLGPRGARHSAHGGGDGCGVAVDGGQLLACLSGTGSGNPGHRVHHRVQLADAVDAGRDVGEALGHPPALAVGTPSAEAVWETTVCM